MKNIIISALVGISFLTSGFWIGLRFAPMPKKPAPAIVAASKPVAAKPPREAFTVDTLKAASENMLSVNDALKAREASVTAREKKVREQEEEIVAERGALDRLHAHFRQLYSEFQQKLQLVSDNEQAQLARQVEIFNSMDPVQVADMMRSLDDGTIVRMFSIMEAKPLSKLVAAWKTKYPNDSARLLIAMNGMGRVLAENKIVLPASPSPVDGTSAPDANAAAPSDGNAPAAATPDANSNPNPTADAASQPATPDASQTSATPAAADPNAPVTTPAPADANANASSPSTPDANSPPSTSTDTPAGQTPAQPADASAPAAPATPPAPATPDAPAAPAATPDAPAPASPTQDSAPAPATPPSGTPTTASTTTSDSTAPLDTPGEIAAKAAAATRHAPGIDETAAEPSEFTPPTAPLPVIHEKPVRIASAKNN